VSYILEELRKIDDPALRREEAERLLRVFDSPHRWEIPKGDMYFGPLGVASKKEMNDILDQGMLFFREIGQYMGDQPTELYQKLQERFERNAAQSRKIETLTYRERCALPPHELHPYFDDFTGALLQDRYGVRDDIVPSVNVLGAGGFATIYAATAKDGTPLALKVFHPREKLGIDSEQCSWHRNILQNIESRKDLFSEEPFTRFVTSGISSLLWYASEFFGGQSLQHLLWTRSVTPEIIGQSMVAYCGMLGKLHEKDLIFMDNSLGNVLVKKDTVKICDYDFVSELDAEWRPRVSTFITASREQLSELPLTFQSDAEGAALMLDALVYGAPLRSDEDWKDRHAQKEQAKLNKYVYPKERAAKLPRQTRHVVKGLLHYPRDPSLTVADLESALRADYGL